MVIILFRAKPLVGATDLQILESVESGTTVFEAAAQLAALDLVLACVLVQRAL